MKPFFKKIIPPAGNSIVYKEDFLENLRDWHFHPEIEIQMNLKGHGTKFIGDCIEPFGNDDLVLLGENLPHHWRKEGLKHLDQRYSKTKDAHVIVVQFHKYFLGKEVFQVPELKNIENLFERASRGLLFFGKTRLLLRDSILKLKNLSNLERLLQIIKILDIMANSAEYRYLGSTGYVERFHKHYDDRINKVYEYTLSRFRKNIKINEVADLICMNEPSFSRYFKQRTQKNYSQFLIDLRLGYACQQLIFTQKDVKQISYESGYRNITNFNRQFRKQVKLTPVEYRKIHQKL